MKKTIALITGASGGIGYELAKLMSKECDTLILVARNGERLNEVKKELERASPVMLKTFQANLASEEAVEEIYRELENSHIAVDILINNAGFGDYGFFVDTDWKKASDMIAVNISAVTHMTKLFAKGMIERKNGKIMNVASTAAFQPGPLMAVYYASKAYVLSFSESLANELKGSGVTVTALCPGPTATGFAAAANIKNTRLFKLLKPATAADVARFGYEAMMKGHTIAVQGMLNRLLAFSVRLSPRKLVAAVVRHLHKNIPS